MSDHLILELLAEVGELRRKVDDLTRLVRAFVGRKGMPALGDLEAQVRSNCDAEVSAAILLRGLASRLAAAVSCQERILVIEKVLAIRDDLADNVSVWAMAIVANTPHALRTRW